MIKLVSSVGFIIFNEENKILLVNRCEDGDRKEIGDKRMVALKNEEKEKSEDLWMIPLGNLDDNDNPRDIIEKKVKKCFNCEVKDCNYFNLYFYNISDNFIKKVSYFYGRIEGEIQTRNKSVMVEWVNLDKEEIKNLNLNAEQKVVLNEFLDFSQSKSFNNIE